MNIRTIKLMVFTTLWDCWANILLDELVVSYALRAVEIF